MQPAGSVQYAAVGKRICTRHKEMHLTQERLAEMAGISPGFVGHLERAEKIPSVETLTRLCVSLRVSMDYLVMGKCQVCDQVKCALYRDLQSILAAYSSDQMESPFEH